MIYPKAKWQAALVHVYTASGMALAFWAGLALFERDIRAFLLALCLAALVDGTDGLLARRFDVKNALPEFDGRKLDDIVDFLTYVFLPALALVRFEVLPAAWAWLAALPVLASAYGFCQERAKTEDAFVGFPSYWNIVFFYLYLLPLPDLAAAALLALLSALVFAPVYYVYPTRTRLWWKVTIGLITMWGLAIVWLVFNLDSHLAPLVALVSLAVPAYYLALSWAHHRRVASS